MARLFFCRGQLSRAMPSKGAVFTSGYLAGRQSITVTTVANKQVASACAPWNGVVCHLHAVRISADVDSFDRY